MRFLEFRCLAGGGMLPFVPSCCAIAVMVATFGGARAQLIDPNNRCVYQPGSRVCQPLQGPPAAPPPTQPSSVPPYEAFLSIARNSGIGIGLHPTYTSGYVADRMTLYCSLLANSESMKIIHEVTFPPVIHMTETPKDRDRLEVVILRVAAGTQCSQFQSQERQIEATIVR